MSEFLQAAFTMPTTIFSWILIVAAVYWTTVFLGLLDLGIIDGLFDIIDGLFEGSAASVEGAAEGVVEGLGERGGCLGLAGVPLSMIGTSIAAFGWVFSYLGMSFLPAAVTGAATVLGIGAGATVLALGATAVALRPVRKLFRIAPVTGRKDLVDKVCVVTTLRVDEKFGQAEVRDNGSAILIQARCLHANDLTRGSKALIFEYDPQYEVFYVLPVDDEMAALSAAAHADAD
ncbi:MAG: hypothetical protein AAF560_09050 [Acidobacteriota bacterium]